MCERYDLYNFKYTYTFCECNKYTEHWTHLRGVYPHSKLLVLGMEDLLNQLVYGTPGELEVIRGQQPQLPETKPGPHNSYTWNICAGPLKGHSVGLILVTQVCMCHCF